VTVALGLAAATAWAAVSVALAPVSRQLSPVALTLWLLAINLAVTAAAMVALGEPRRLAWGPVACAIAAGLLEVVAVLSWVHAVRVGSVAVVSPIIGLEGGVAAVIAIALGEPSGPLVAAGIVIAIAGGVLTAAEGRARTAAGAGWAVLAACAFGTMFALYGHADALGPFAVVTIARVAGMAVLLPVALVRGEASIPRRLVGRVAACGLVDALAFCLFAVAVAIGPVAVAAVCGAQFSTVGAVLAIVLLHERLRRHQVVGIGIAAVGTTLLGLAG
jgi:drug/metabolite transporter (DMT)-like permease